MSYQADHVFLELQHGNPGQLIPVYGSFVPCVYKQNKCVSSMYICLKIEQQQARQMRAYFL